VLEVSNTSATAVAERIPKSANKNHIAQNPNVKPGHKIHGFLPHSLQKREEWLTPAARASAP
jgi:hypothetical protein